MAKTATKEAEDQKTAEEANADNTSQDEQTQEAADAVAEAPQTERTRSGGRRTAQPEGQTIPGANGDDGFDVPITGQLPFGETEPTITREKDDKSEGDFRNSAVAKNFRKLTGYKAGDIMAVNERTHVIVTTNGGKYQLNRKGNQVRHLQGPAIPKTFQGEDLSDTYVDQRARTPFTGTAAAINASVHEQPANTRGERANDAVQTVAEAEAALEAARERAENARAEAGE